MKALSDVSTPARSIPGPDDNPCPARPACPDPACAEIGCGRIGTGHDGIGAGDEGEALRAALTRTLRQLREVLHRRARFSSRAQALDEVARLFFAHVVTALHQGGGICARSVLVSGIDQDRPAEALSRFVGQAVLAHLPASLAREMEIG